MRKFLVARLRPFVPRPLRRWLKAQLLGGYALVVHARMTGRAWRETVTARLSSRPFPEWFPLQPMPSPAALAAAAAHPARPRPARRADIVAFSIIDWRFRYQRPQQILARFAAHGHRVFYLNPAGFRLTGGAPRFLLRRVQPNVYDVTLTGVAPPNLYKTGPTAAELDRLLAALDRLRRIYDIQDAVSYVMLPAWEPLAAQARARWGWTLVYDCMDDWEHFPGIEPAVHDAERSLVAKADLVLVTARQLRDKWAATSRRLLVVPNAADYRFYAERCRPNSRLAGATHPIVGYFGAIAEWFDVDLLAFLARERPTYTFVLLGGVFNVDVAGLQALPNVRLLGQQAYAAMPEYLYHFDVALIPFKRNRVTTATDPVKLYEYFSAGKPVVSTRLPEVERFGAHLYLADGPAEFLRQLDAAVADVSPDAAARRRRLARRHTWEARYRTIRKSLAAGTPRASLVVVTYNNLALTRLCLESIIRNTGYPNYEIVVVDNASTDGTRNYLNHLVGACSRLRVVFNVTNEGFPRAANRGLDAATGERLVLLNNDVVVPPGWLTRLLRHLGDPAVGLVGPVTNSVGNEAYVRGRYRTWHQMEVFAGDHAWRHTNHIADIHTLAMYCVGLRRAVYHKVGPLDEQFGLGLFEDDDYSLRVRRLGYRVVCALDVFVHHFGQASFRDLITKGAYDTLFEKNRKHFEEKWATRWTPHRHGTLAATPHRPIDDQPEKRESR